MMCVIFCVGVWLLVASKYELPVSTTHSAVGGIIGMTMMVVGSDCVTWKKKSDDFPYVKGVSAIVISWVLSPVLSAFSAVALYLFVRTFVLRSKDSFTRTLWFFPFLVGFTLVLNTYFIVYKGSPQLGLKDTTFAEASIYAFSIGLGLTALIMPFIIPMMKRSGADYEERLSAAKAKRMSRKASGKEIDVKVDMPGSTGEGSLSPTSAKAIDATSAAVEFHKDGQVAVEAPAQQDAKKSCWQKLVTYIDYSMNEDVHDVIDADENVQALHDNAEKHDGKTEDAFRYLQVFTAICDSFSHGANDVANSIGPFAAIYMIWRDKEVSKKGDLGDDAYWILGLGGVGIVAGLALYGYKIMKAIGVKLAKITPSRGFAIELGAAFIIIIGSRQGWPLSTTHCQVGATTGVGLLEGSKGVNWNIVGKTVAGWLLTCVVVGFSAAVLTAQGAYAPCAV